MYKKIFLIFLSFSIIFANDILNEIKNDIKELKKIATITKENESYQPYIISTFKGEELEKLGVTNLKEALELIPGVDIATDNADIKTAIFRGSNPFAYGQSKLIIDGVCVNNLMTDSYNEFLYMPVEIIKRIEVVRGPGSRTDGVNAYAGSIKVITYAEQFKEKYNKLFFKIGSYRYRGGGFLKTYKKGDIKLFSDFYYQKDDKFLSSGKDILDTGLYGDYNKRFSKSKNAPLWIRNYSLGLTFFYKDLIFRLRKTYLKHGSAYGINFMLPQNRDYTKFLNDFLEVSYKKDIYEIKFGIRLDEFYSNARLAPPGIIFPNPLDNNALVEYKDGFFGIHDTKQRTFYHSFFFNKEKEKHHFKYGYRVSKEETYKVVTKTTDRFGNSSNLVDYSEIYPFFDKSAKRDTIILSFLDDYEIKDNLTLSYGINIENNTHIDTEYNPRMALVYIKDKDIYKFIYSRSIRNPSWQELYTINNSARVGNRDLKPEIVNAFEFSFIKKFSIDNFFQFNLFYLKNKDQINNANDEHIYINAENCDIYGFELEYKTVVGNRGKFFGNYSFVDGKNDKDEPIANVAKHMLKGYFLYELTSNIDINMIGKYVGKKRRLSYDNREDLKDYTLFDIGLNYKNLKYNYTINFSIKNIFNKDIRYPSQPNTYKDDYKQEGRNYMISFRKVF